MTDRKEMATLRQGTSEVSRQTRGRKVILPRVLGTMVLLTFTVDFRVDFHCSKPPCLQSLLQQPENLRTSKKHTLFFWEWRSHHYSGSADRLVSLINVGNQITLLVQKQMTTVCKSLPSTMIFFLPQNPVSLKATQLSVWKNLIGEILFQEQTEMFHRGAHQ